MLCITFYMFQTSIANFFSLMVMISGTQWLHSNLEVGGYEEYSGMEYRSAGCSEEYNVIE